MYTTANSGPIKDEFDVLRQKVRTLDADLPPFNDSAKITSPDLALGDAIRVIYILEQTTGQARWRWTWEPVGFEHSDLYGFGDDSYEF